MKSRYNIALIPTSRSDEIVRCAKHFDMMADNYLLGERSLPHVTLYQFLADANEITVIIDQLESSDIHKSIDLTFDSFSCITFDNITYWASLMPDHRPELISMHREVSSLIDRPEKLSFDPHMTLMNTRNKYYESHVEVLKKNFEPIMDAFILSIGLADDAGQYLEVVHLVKDRCLPRFGALR